MDFGVWERVHGWQAANVAVWIALAVTNGVEVAEEVKEGTGQRKGTKYPESDEITDVAVMIGVQAALMVLDILIPPTKVQSRLPKASKRFQSIYLDNGAT